jgi:hypothetical protein
MKYANKSGHGVEWANIKYRNVNFRKVGEYPWQYMHYFSKVSEYQI